jgi:carbamoyl-phosphate synthase/aspartate carbamoyltransferase
MMPADGLRPVFAHSQSNSSFPAPPVTFSPLNDDDVMSASNEAVLELNDGSAFRGISFGAEQKSVAGECVFQTGGIFFHRLMLCR